MFHYVFPSRISYARNLKSRREVSIEVTLSLCSYSSFEMSAPVVGGARPAVHHQQQQQQQQQPQQQQQQLTRPVVPNNLPRLDPVAVPEDPVAPPPLRCEEVVLATAGYDHTIKFWQAHTGQCTRTIQHADSQVSPPISIPICLHLHPNYSFFSSPQTLTSPTGKLPRNLSRWPAVGRLRIPAHPDV